MHVENIVIVGAGPCGIASAIYLERAGIHPLLLECDEPGGLLRQASFIENYPGFPDGIESTALVDLFIRQLSRVGGSVTRSKVDRLTRKDDLFHIETAHGLIRSRAAIVATGTRPRPVEIPGSEKIEGKFLFYDLLDLISADGGKKVAIYGGGDAAVDHALNLQRRGYEITIVCRSKCHCLPLLRQRSKERDIEILEGKRIVNLGGTLNIYLEDGTILLADRMLIACGRDPRLEILDPSISSMLELGRSVDGLFIAGDAASGKQRQVGIAVGSGLSAAMMAEEYLKGGSARRY